MISLHWKPLFEELFYKLFFGRNNWKYLSIGILLSFIPVLNIFAFGYLYRHTFRFIHLGESELGEWNDWQNLFYDGLRFAFVWLLYWLIPLVAMVGVGYFAQGNGLDAFIQIGLTIGVLYFSIVFCVALNRVQALQNFKILSKFRLLIKLSNKLVLPMLIPLLVFYGFHMIVKPLYGVSFFLGFLVLLSYSAISMQTMAIRGKRAL